ncbi:MAG: NAD(P)/FAD-dependent oxidoreductase [Actinomycetota bacterium]
MSIAQQAQSELLEVTDEQLEDIVAFADPLVLRGLIYQLTGDEDLKNQVKTVRAQVMFAEAAIPASEEDIALIRRKAVEFLKSYRDSGGGHLDIGPLDRLEDSIRLATGSDPDPDHMAMLVEELGLDPWVRAHQWSQKPDPEKLENFSVTVIGAGYGGLNAAVMLKRAGIPYTHIEKDGGVGGTWYRNRYPGARVDSPSRAYTHVFGTDVELDYAFCPRADNQAYFDWVADANDIRDHIEFDTEVRALTWDEDLAKWKIDVTGPDGERTIESNAVITAVGFLCQPNLPKIPGMADFKGQSWHSSRWPEDVKPDGKRIAVIGTGSTGYQMVPELALTAEHVVVFQKEASWVFGIPGYRAPYPPQVKWLERNLPFHKNFSRLRGVDVTAGWDITTDRDPDYSGDPKAVSDFNKQMRDNAIEFLQEKLPDDDLRAKMTPDYPVWSHRPVLVDTEYNVLVALNRDNVTLVTDAIAEVNETGIKTVDGAQHDVDIIVYATGFRANDYLYPMKVTGRETTLEQTWRETGTCAYRFCMVHGFPNLFMLHGPNTIGGITPGPWVELVTQYALMCIDRLITTDKKSVDVSEDAYRSYMAQVYERQRTKAWSDPRADSYYQGQGGSPSAVMSPYPPETIFRLLRYPEFDDLEVR